MPTLLPARIAGRYLRSRKSHTAVGAIATVSVIGMVVATAAIVCVLSVFNGFRSAIGDRLDTLAPDVLVEPTAGKVFANADSTVRVASRVTGVAVATPTIADNALLLFNGREMPVYLKGIDPSDYSSVTSINKLIRADEGRMLTAGMNRGIPETTLSIGAAQQMSAFPGDRILLFAPKRHGRVDMANPAASFISDSLHVAGVFRSMSNEYDENYILVDLPTARRLLQYDTEASAIEIKTKPGEDPAVVAQRLATALGDRFVVKDRLRQQEMNFRMIEIEKWVSFLLLGFILLIASFNVISTLSMLVLEKENSLSTLEAMGMSRNRVGSVFAWESLIIALTGGLCGIAVGVTLCLLQQHYGFIRIGDGTSSILASYPVELHIGDLFATMIPVLAIGAITAFISSRFAKSRLSPA